MGAMRLLLRRQRGCIAIESELAGSSNRTRGATSSTQRYKFQKLSNRNLGVKSGCHCEVNIQLGFLPRALNLEGGGRGSGPHEEGKSEQQRMLAIFPPLPISSKIGSKQDE
ncbi:hypothetical protein CMUS01_09677 [Colletotrichum musicola]|uniref:Uncharacterized protein n=1 Tax=Colletotrichum musicola TaxID=2175873 RepID=A0A8H6K6G6_9PEZI|nr:hypothetical protein CMUS01_09677 [Colletotrichum musicola]